MVREIYDTELDDLLKLYLDLHEDTVPERNIEDMAMQQNA